MLQLVHCAACQTTDDQGFMAQMMRQDLVHQALARSIMMRKKQNKFGMHLSDDQNLSKHDPVFRFLLPQHLAEETFHGGKTWIEWSWSDAFGCQVTPY